MQDLYTPNRKMQAINHNTNQIMNPTHAGTNNAVRIPAPALSAVVIARVLISCGAVWSFVPLAGLLELFPPVDEVTGVVFFVVIRFDEKRAVAIICSSRPLQPSQLRVYHRTPQVLLLFPEQDLAAASAEPCSLGRMVS